MHVKKLLTIATLGLSFGFPVPSAAGQKIYWTDTGNDIIQRADRPGADVEHFVATGSTSGVYAAGSNPLPGPIGVCEGKGCTEPCPAEGACNTDTDCDPGMFCCNPLDCPEVCAPSICHCDPITDTWGCTRDCNGVCTPLPPIPTLSEWGLIIMGLLLLAAGTICVRRVRRSGHRRGTNPIRT